MNIREILNLINKAGENNDTRAYVCGGVPRDKFMGRLNNISDIDITTGDGKSIKIFHDVFKVLSETNNIRQRVAKDGHGTISFKNIKIDFSSNFISSGIEEELNKIGIKNPTSLQKEMFSRDFTCNALLLDTSLKNFTDPTNQSIKDIKNKIVKTPLSPEVTFLTLEGSKNEPMIASRIARSIYLACKLDFDVHPSIIDWVSQNPEIILKSNQKVLIEKLTKSFKFNKEKTISLIKKMGIKDFIPTSL